MDSIKERHLCRRNKITVLLLIYLVLAVSFCRNGLPVYEELKYLAEVRRFGMAIMFFSDKDKKGKNNHTPTRCYWWSEVWYNVLVKLATSPPSQTMAQCCYTRKRGECHGVRVSTQTR